MLKRVAGLKLVKPQSSSFLLSMNWFRMGLPHLSVGLSAPRTTETRVWPFFLAAAQRQYPAWPVLPVLMPMVPL